MNKHQISSLGVQIEPIVRQAGMLLMSSFGKPLERAYKKDGAVVTQADQITEQFLIRELSVILPEAAFYAEESGVLGEHDYCWVIDALDGTNNFVHGLPYFCISVALTYKDRPIVGVVYQPLLDEYFYAESEKGASLNGSAIRVSAKKGADRLFIVADPRIESVYHAYGKKHSIRYFGASALDLAYYAAGRIDAVLIEKTAWWDIAAGILLVEQAGGYVTDFRGNKLGRGGGSLLAAAPGMGEDLKDLVKDENIV